MALSAFDAIEFGLNHRLHIFKLKPYDRLVMFTKRYQEARK
jgi:hypothetical protein